MKIEQFSVKSLETARNAGMATLQAEGRAPSSDAKKLSGIKNAIQWHYDNGVDLPSDLVPTVYRIDGEDKLGEGFHRSLSYLHLFKDTPDETIPVFIREFESLPLAILAARASNAPDKRKMESVFQIAVSMVNAMNQDKSISFELACQASGVDGLKQSTFNQYKSLVNKLKGPLSCVRKGCVDGSVSRVAALAILERWEVAPPKSVKQGQETARAYLESALNDLKAFRNETSFLNAPKADKPTGDADSAPKADKPTGDADNAPKADKPFYPGDKFVTVGDRLETVLEFAISHLEATSAANRKRFIAELAETFGEMNKG